MLEKPDGFISDLEKQIVLLRHRGNSFITIAGLVNGDATGVEKIYQGTMDKVRQLEEQLPDGAEGIFPCKTVCEFLDQLGAGPDDTGRYELTEAIRFSYRKPEMLDAIQYKFFPQLAKQLDTPEKLVAGRVYKIIKNISYRKNEQGTPVYVFFKIAGLGECYEIKLKQFLLTAHQCISELYDFTIVSIKKHL